MNRYASICIACTRLRFDAEKAMCDAFPRGIPDEIAFGMFDHRERFPGDRGIRFELRVGFQRDLEMYEASKAQFEDDVDYWAREQRSKFRLIEGG